MHELKVSHEEPFQSIWKSGIFCRRIYPTESSGLYHRSSHRFQKRSGEWRKQDKTSQQRIDSYMSNTFLGRMRGTGQGAIQVGGKNNFVSTSESNRLRQILLWLNSILKNYAEDTQIRVHTALKICGKNETQNMLFVV